eukprot:gene25622-11278_t
MQIETYATRWVPLESDPAVMNSLATLLGWKDVESKLQFCDIFGLDDEMLAFVPTPVLAVIMCHPITQETEEAAKAQDSEQEGSTADEGGPFFIKQTISNSCATIAVLHSLANCLASGHASWQPDAQSPLGRFMRHSATLSPSDRGLYLERKNPDCDETNSIGDVHQNVIDLVSPFYFITFVD